MYGWGVVNKHNDRSIRLRKYTTYTQDITTCQNEHINITATHHICTYNRASQSYKGDSGAPALYTMPRKRCHKPGSRTKSDSQAGSRIKSDRCRAGSRTKCDKCPRSKTRCGPLTINLDELCEAISDKSNRSTQTHNTVCLHYSCDTISSSRTNDSNNSTQAHYTVLLNDLYKIIKTRCGPLTINLDELCEAISDKSNRSTQTHYTVCLHYSCDTISSSSSRTNDRTF
ncbi:uncharacterized protein LOC113467242 [Diaphorina citri]|uniref:Uncharacterized protein LOC113467242 n=1 Tax=Diaphorina citri TaxID=121845 RepID=A0A3Q0IXI3_DIACI|nr:uncharacterized protein LOC113467242 [Diaphorina citri]